MNRRKNDKIENRIDFLKASLVCAIAVICLLLFMVAVGNSATNIITIYNKAGEQIGLISFDNNALQEYNESELPVVPTPAPLKSDNLSIEYVKNTHGYLAIGLKGVIGEKVTCRALDASGNTFAINSNYLRAEYQEMLISNAGEATSASCSYK